jgi:hypothetical protein
MCKVYLVTHKVPEALLAPEDVIPAVESGRVTDVLAVGRIRALQSRKDRWDPAPGGVSIGHFAITAGTLGCAVESANHGLVILSNNHVLANSNEAFIGDDVLQPGPIDGGYWPIGHLTDYEPIEFGDAPPVCGLAETYASVGNALAKLVGSSHRVKAYDSFAGQNVMDAAIATPINDNVVDKSILEIGMLDGTMDASPGMRVQKSGRTTGLTSGNVSVIYATVQVSYGAGQTAIFMDQIISGPMSQGGDSGSLLVTDPSEGGKYAVGLLFAGSSLSTIYSPIQYIEDRFQLLF